MRIGLMVEGQNGVTWERWLRILQMAERLGFPSVFSSDHYFIGRQQDSLEAYLSFAVAARETTSIRFGPLVSPITFRSPVDLGRMAAQLSLLSGGRFVMGMGAGWNEAEHVAYGIPFPPVKERMDRLEEGIQVVKALWGGPADFEGRYYRLQGADCLPRPGGGRPPLIVGGGGEQRTLKLVAKYADEWNCVNVSPEAFRHKLGVLERHCETVGRDPATIRKSMMCFGMVGPSDAYVDGLLERYGGRLGGAAASGSRAEKLAAARERGMIAGNTGEVVEQLKALEALGMEEVQFQHFDFDSEEVPAYLAGEVAPAVR